MILALLPLAAAHTPGLSKASVDATHLALAFSRTELAALVPVEDLTASRVLLAETISDHAEVSFGGVPCDKSDPVLSVLEGDGVGIDIALDCPGGGEGRYTAGFLATLGAAHRHHVEALGEPVAVLDASRPTATFTGESAPAEVARRFFALGVEHIWTGWDHLAFLGGLLLAATRLRGMLWIVTGFTVAHSITLSLAALGLVNLSPMLVEPAIAATIAYVGVENFWRPGVRRRVAVTFVLGLVHGFGFAGLLRELGLPKGSLALALGTFNLGVEVGQAAVVAAVAPLLLWARRRPWWETRAVPVASAALVFAGLYWFVERVF